ncbi:dUTP diphosphatase [Helicobacter pametensis]|uniref:dUTP diphosphatase n=1 Tax=Helicobacter pametensis TaxID=95149 RepID=UPI000482D3DC|nr:dUTP diphosphatase [Helicobacter pametensis]
MKVRIKKLHQDAVVPEYQSIGASGFDLCSLEELVLKSGQWSLIKTGLAFEIPIGFELQVRPRSGLALKYGITVLNSPGTIDSDYRGEVGVVLINHSQKEFKIFAGDRIAQGVIAQISQVEFETVGELSQTCRGDRGFGSSGISKNKG